MNQLAGPLARVGRYTPIRAYYDANTEAKAWTKLLAFFDQHMPTGTG